MIKIVVPGTSANMGPGFDCMGIALKIYNTFIFEEIESGLVVEGAEKSFDDEDNLIYKSMKKVYEKTGNTLKGVRIISSPEVPISRGLGSSATCIIAGMLGANKFLKNPLNQQEILNMATEMEGHPDNVAPALLGGCITSVYEGGKVYWSRISIADGIKFYALIPNFKLSTKKARDILPEKVDFKDAVYNVGRASLMTSVLQNGRFELLKIAGKDKLHQEYRKHLIEGYDSIVNVSMKSGAYGVFLSGAGPTMLVAVNSRDKEVYNGIRSHVNDLRYYWDIRETFVSKKGAILRNLNK